MPITQKVNTKQLSTLIVIALQKGKAKLLGACSGKDENTDAKKLADTVAPWPKEAQTPNPTKPGL